MEDPGEERNLIGKRGAAKMQARLDGRLAAFFDRYADPKYDLWKDGKAKTRAVVYGKDRVWPVPGAATK